MALVLAQLAAAGVAAAYSFDIQTTPRQCTNLTIATIGSGGSPPYNVLIIPFGSSPLPNNIEARKIIFQPFSGSDTSVTFQLPYPTNSQFVAVVSDSNGFATGGTSGAATVISSSDSSCFNATQQAVPDFFLNINPPNQIVQCTSTRIFWDASAVQGTPTIYGVIPGGQSFLIPVGPLTTVNALGTGFDWIPSVRAGTTLILGAGDNRGLGAGGSTQQFVNAGLNPTSGCLNSTSPSSTPGSPAGGTYPTSTSGATNDGGNVNGSGNNVGAIVGGVIGGIVAILAFILVLIFWRRRRRQHQRAHLKERPDLFTDNEGADETSPYTDGDDRLRPEPYIVPSDAGGTENTGFLQAGGRASESADGRERRLSTMTGTTSDGRPLTPGIAASSSAGVSRKSGMPAPLRPVNIIQHDDAGAIGEGERSDEPETVELPPAYTNLKKNDA